MRGSCSVAIAMPVHRQLVHITLPVPLHVGQKVRMPADVATAPAPAPPAAEADPSREMSLPRVPHCAHGRYPVPLQYTQRVLPCSCVGVV